MEEKDKLKERYIPDNVFQGKRVFGIKRRNRIEGVISFFIVARLISMIPFVNQVKWIVTVCIGITVFILIAVGIKNQSLTEFVLNVVRFRKYSKPIHYRRITNATENPKPLIVNGKVTTIKENHTKSIVKKFVRK